MTKFIFDLDGTITKEETLPLIARRFNIDEKIKKLTMETVKGNIPFMESFIKRVHILGKLPADEISDLLYDVPVFEKTVNFIQNNLNDCIVATGNLNCWVDKICSKLKCKSYSSIAEVQNNQVVKIKSILKKENIVTEYKEKGEKVVFIGDGNNDFEAMRIADISIASGVIHNPANSVLSVANYLVYSEEALCRQLNQLL